MTTRIALPKEFHAVSGYGLYDLDGPHLQTCVELDQIIHEAMPADKKEDFLPHDLTYYQKKVANGQRIVGAFDQARLIAKANLTVDLHQADHAPMLHRHLTLEQFQQYVMISGAAVHPDYRGKGLQIDLVKARALLAQELGKQYLMAVFAAGSDISRDNCERMGMSAMTDFEPSIFFGTPIQFFTGKAEDALNYKHSPSGHS